MLRGALLQGDFFGWSVDLILLLFFLIVVCFD